jgi:3-phenylpropionate/cinnamic acid dioxygenase small subunit
MSLSLDDRVAITDLIAMHGHLTDDGELDRYDELFTADVVYDLTDFGLGQLEGVAAIRDAGRALGEANPVGHHVTNVVLRELDDGDVQVRSKAIGIMADGTAGSLVYDDLVKREQGVWRIARRRVTRRQRPLGAQAR